MSFLEPVVLFILPIVIIVSIVLAILTGRGSGKLEQLISKKRWNDLVKGYSPKRRVLKVVLASLAACFLVLAVARPSWGSREQMVVDRGLDILIALDVSRSMLAEDASPNRLEHAKSQIRQFLNSVPGNRVGLMPFAGDAYVQIPITSDYEFLIRKLDSLNVDSIRTPGTNFTRALEVANLAFEQGAIGTKILVFITDGENHAEGLQEKIQAAKNSETRIYAIGLGSEEGSNIVVNNTTLTESGTGEPITTRLDTATLKMMADETGGGAYVSQSGSRIDIQPLIRDIQYLESIIGAEKSATRYIPEERFQLPLAIALFFLLLEGLISSTWFPKRRLAT